MNGSRGGLRKAIYGEFWTQKLKPLDVVINLRSGIEWMVTENNDVTIELSPLVSLPYLGKKTILHGEAAVGLSMKTKISDTRWTQEVLATEPGNYPVQPIQPEPKNWKHGYCQFCGCEMSPALDRLKDTCSKCEPK